jgi:hypothetical protein
MKEGKQYHHSVQFFVFLEKSTEKGMVGVGEGFLLWPIGRQAGRHG